MSVASALGHRATDAAPTSLRVLTKPYEPNRPQGHDNINDDLIVTTGDVFVSSLGMRYIVMDMLGQGTFGQVFKCTVQDSGETVAVKVIKNQAAYFHQARVEIGILQFLNTRADPADTYHLVRLKDFFLHRDHLCLVFELLGLNLFELVRHNKFKGLSLSLVRVFVSQVLEALVVLHRAGIIHCDLKPENILLTNSESGQIKLIDFGSACFANRTAYTYIQSRFYRSPEVVLGHQYTTAVDMWSLGCVAAELFLGLPLFPAACEHDLLTRMLETLGTLPDTLLRQGRHCPKYFTNAECTVGPTAQVRLRTAEEFENLTGQKATRGKQYFNHKALADIIDAYPIKSGLSPEQQQVECIHRKSFTNFLEGLLDLNPGTRWSPRQALQHPFITGKPYKQPFRPTVPDEIGESNDSMVNQQHPDSTIGGWPVPVAAAPSMMATSPQMHAQAHAAAMAVVQQMQLGMSNGAAPGTSPYTPARSLRRITTMSLHAQRSAHSDGIDVSAGFQQPSSLSSSHPMHFFSPPSRSFGVPPPAVTVDMPVPSFEIGSQGQPRIMPLMPLPGSFTQQQSPALYGAASFQPSSVGTFQSVLATTGNRLLSVQNSQVWAEPQYRQTVTDAAGGRWGSSHVWLGDDLREQQSAHLTTAATPDLEASELERTSAAITPHKDRATPVQEEAPNPADWDPLWR
jgi:dual specificity protein kinase YAK1